MKAALAGRTPSPDQLMRRAATRRVQTLVGLLKFGRGYPVSAAVDVPGGLQPRHAWLALSCCPPERAQGAKSAPVSAPCHPS